MASRIEDYALIGNGVTGALVDRNGSIDWLCLPRFDSGACFAALLGTPANGFWRIGPSHPATRVKRRYRPGTLVLETEFGTPEGRALLLDCMRFDCGSTDVLRLVRGLEGTVQFRGEMCVRFDYGSAQPWITRLEDGRFHCIAGAAQVVLASGAEVVEKNGVLISDFSVKAGGEVEFSLTWGESYQPPPESPAVNPGIERVSQQWVEWSKGYRQDGPYAEAVLRSLITLKALANPRSGGIVAAATTSLPEEIGGPRNWDYRYCWLRDATFTLYALMQSGFKDEAKQWRAWLLRAVAGAPGQMQIMYGVTGERLLTEIEIDWLSGYEASKPVRVGNAASGQLQLDVYGEVLDLLYQAHRTGLEWIGPAWTLAAALANHIVKIWNQPDDGIWEVRGGRRQFTHSKVMAWVAIDRAIRSTKELGLEGPLEDWRTAREAIHSEVISQGFNSKLGSFVQYFGSDKLDASLLLMPQVGFLPATDPAVVGTVSAIEKNLMRDGLVRRYDPQGSVDGVKGSEGFFLPCSFWLADIYTLQNRQLEAGEMFERLLALRNDVGLLSEEYNTQDRRQVGNFPQAFSHVALINTAKNLSGVEKPAVHRSGR
jgi:GH15 family glucan-1,4-alpha-glucosidase